MFSHLWNCLERIGTRSTTPGPPFAMHCYDYFEYVSTMESVFCKCRWRDILPVANFHQIGATAAHAGAAMASKEWGQVPTPQRSPAWPHTAMVCILPKFAKTFTECSSFFLPRWWHTTPFCILARHESAIAFSTCMRFGSFVEKCG